METVSVKIKKNDTHSSGFRAIAGSLQSIGRTPGEALDALMAEWDGAEQTADVLIEALEENEDYVEPYLTNENGFCVIAGGRMSEADAKRDFVAEMREERMRSFFPAALNFTD